MYFWRSEELRRCNFTIFVKAAKETSQQLWEKAPGRHSWQHLPQRPGEQCLARGRGSRHSSKGISPGAGGLLQGVGWGGGFSSLAGRSAATCDLQKNWWERGGRRKGRESPRTAGGRLPSVKEYPGNPRARASEQRRPLVPRKTNQPEVTAICRRLNILHTFTSV